MSQRRDKRVVSQRCDKQVYVSQRCDKQAYVSQRRDKWTRTCHMSESSELLTQIAAELKMRQGLQDADCQNPQQLYAQMSHASNTRKCQVSESVELWAQIDAARDQSPLENASLETPRMQEFNKLFCQIALGEHEV